jgi:glycosyltransferase involved in cell wall biosynthesis
MSGSAATAIFKMSLPNHDTTPKVSVCVQTYRHASFIEQCLRSILMQKTSFPYEIILGEDDSDDGTREICVRLAASHPGKIRLFLRSRKDVIHIGGRPTGRFNFKSNLKEARGSYVAMCEGDDYWTDENKLQKQVDFLDSHPDFSLCFHRVQVLQNGQLTEDRITRVPKPETTILDLAKENYIHTPTVMFRAGLELPLWFDEVIAGDYALHLLNALRGKLYCLDDVMAVYRVHDGGMWSMKKEEDNQLRWVEVLETLCRHFGGEAGRVLRIQRLNWAMTLYRKGYREQMLPVLREHADLFPDLHEELESEIHHLITRSEVLSKKVSGTFLIKSLINRITGRVKGAK